MLGMRHGEGVNAAAGEGGPALPANGYVRPW
jgi:hypothetical protein